MKSKLVINILKVLLLTIFTFAFFIQSNNVFAQIDIQSVTPEPTQPSQSAPGSAQPGGRGFTPQSGGTGDTPSCVGIDDLRNQEQVKGGIIVGQDDNGYYYAVRKNGDPLTADEVLNKIKKIKRTPWQNTDALSGPQVTGDSCGVRFSAHSPTIFIYSPNTKVQPMVPILYLENNDQYLYYEYDSTNISFNKPKYGWIVSKQDLAKFSSYLSNILDLTSIESERLFFELNFSASDVKSDKLFIGLIPQKEVDENIPLKIISPNNPKVIRHHFYVAEAKNKNVKPPQLNPVQRDEFLILEFGSWLEK